MNELAQFISNVGFPVFVAVWMLYKSSADNEKMMATINELKNAINLLTNEFKHNNITEENNHDIKRN